MLSFTVETPFKSHTIPYIYEEVRYIPLQKNCLGLCDLLNNNTTQ